MIHEKPDVIMCRKIEKKYKHLPDWKKLSEKDTFTYAKYGNYSRNRRLFKKINVTNNYITLQRIHVERTLHKYI